MNLLTEVVERFGSVVASMLPGLLKIFCWVMWWVDGGHTMVTMSRVILYLEGSERVLLSGKWV